LEGERVWTRSRRRRGLAPGAVAYLLDRLVIVGAVLALVGAATLFVEGLISIAAMVGGVIGGERVGLLIVGMAIALGLALALARVARGRRAAQIAAGAVTSPINSGAIAADAPLPGERFEEQPTPALAMMQERWQPAATSVPTSFLDLVEPHSNTPARSRFALASTLLMLALMVMLVSVAVLFRQPLMNILLGMEASYGGVVEAGRSLPPSQPDAGAENAAANVGAAAASAASAPTAASHPAAVAPAAPLSASDAQGVQKRVKSNSLNLRALPGTDQQVVVVLKQGDMVIVFTDARLLRDAIWVKVRAGDYEGWVDQSLLE
jgi:Bacterial SH3 domain